MIIEVNLMDPEDTRRYTKKHNWDVCAFQRWNRGGPIHLDPQLHFTFSEKSDFWRKGGQGRQALSLVAGY